MKKALSLVLVCAVAAAGYWVYKTKEKVAMNVELIPREVLFGNPEKSMVRLSPNGKHLSFGSPQNGVQNVFIANADTPSEAKPITEDKGRGIRSYFWLYDNQHVVYLKDDGGDENWRIHVVDIQTKEDQVFTPEKVNARIFNVSDKFPEEILIGLNDRDPSYHDVYRLNIRTGEKTLILQNDSGFRDFIFDEDYRLRFASSTTADGGAQYFKAIPTEEPRKYNWESFLQYEMEDIYTTGMLGLTYDGTKLYMIDSRGRDLNILKEINLSDNSETVLAEAKKAEIGGIIAHPVTGIIQAYSVNYLRNEWSYFDKALEAHMSVIKKTITGEAAIVSRTHDDTKWIVADMKDDGPIGCYVYTTADKSLKFLFSHRDVLTKYKLAKMDSVVIKARDGLEMPCYVTKPLNATGAVPLVVLVHGGPWARDDWGYDAEAQWLSNRGYAVLQVNFRSSTGFGKSFTSKGNLEWGRKMHEDLLDAVQWAVKEGIADPAKVAIYGGSYGGYAALWGATQSADVFKCAVDIVGPSNLETLLASFPAYWASFMEIAYRQVGDPRTDDGRALLKERSPLTHVDKIKIPVLIAQGEKDPRVKLAESEQIVAAMKEKGLPYIYMLFKDEGHGFARPENKFAFYALAERFLAEHLNGRFESIKDELDKTTLEAAQIEELKQRFSK
jgi:dipeptidyl aminopeptidase/acylaminoacyl peptidase